MDAKSGHFTVDLLIKFSARAETINIDVLSNGVVNKNAGKPAPAYPQVAKDNKLQGVVVLEVDVAANGTVSDATVVTGPAVLVQPALDAVRQWVYKPTLLAGQPVEAVSTVTFNFAILQ
jgi:protein TonB